MKIISIGAEKKPKQCTVVCSNCNSILLVDDTDGVGKSGGRNDSYRVVPCPVCKKELWIDLDQFH